ncbi:hypothetical protein [Yinghuangia soli]|uniref:Bulb-type lectin domain-containing protein n=1 Tax=Yinghuangia soli TaxID=2908204 RepID=A0AA41Q525_9ACTN|nr:hypothetical protein [Yinghuangia soli]MCF2530247.1 hypothetical protein [Yinghuangia soli]
MSRVAVLVAANLLAVVGVSTGTVAAAPGVPAANGDCRNDGTSFDDRLIPGHCLRNGGYRFEMQYDGNLVLYSGGRACWSSGTDGTDGVYAEFSGDWQLDSPWFSLESPYGRLRKYHGKYTGAHKTGNVSLNGKGEVWIAYGKFVSC